MRDNTIVELQLKVTELEEAPIRQAAALLGITPEQFIIDSIKWKLAQPVSRNKREGRFVGRAGGKAVRWRKVRNVHFAADLGPQRIRSGVSSGKARAVMQRRKPNTTTEEIT